MARSNVPWNTIAVVGAGVYLWHAGYLPRWLESVGNLLPGTIPSPTPVPVPISSPTPTPVPTPVPTPTPTPIPVTIPVTIPGPEPTPVPVPTAAQIQAWAASIGLPACIGQAFVNQYSRLPGTIGELDSWGTSSGHKHSDGSWHC